MANIAGLPDANRAIGGRLRVIHDLCGRSGLSVQVRFAPDGRRDVPGLAARSATAAAWMAIARVLCSHLEAVWREPDERIWEVRGPRQHFTHSKVIAWVAFDREVKSLEQLGLEGLIDRWRAVGDEIHADVCRNAFDPELGSFVQAYGSKALDASLLLLPIVGFLPPSDPRIVGTVHAIERRLMVDGLVFRYDSGETGKRSVRRAAAQAPVGPLVIRAYS